MKKSLIFTALALIFIMPAQAANIDTSSRWLLINSYPEFAAKGSSSGVVFHGITSAGSNPAAIAKIENVEFAVMHNQWLQGIIGEKLSVGKNFDAGSLGFELVYNNLGSVPVLLADQFGNPVITTDIVNLNSWGASLIYAKKIKVFSLGMAVKIFSEDLSGGVSYSGFADVGFIYEGFLNDRINLGVSLMNIAPESDGFSKPIDLKAAIDYTYSHGGEPVIDVFAGCNFIINEMDVTGQAGFDYYFFNTLILRGGITLSRELDADVKIGFSAGAGLKIEGMTLNYSYEPGTTLGDSHKISISAVFGKNAVSSEEADADTALSGKATFDSYMESGDYYYNDRQYKAAIKYYEYINLLYWKDLEDKGDKEKSNFFQKLGICYYNIKDSKRAAQYFERALFFDKENEILKHWIKLLK